MLTLGSINGGVILEIDGEQDHRVYYLNLSILQSREHVVGSP